MQPSIPSDPLPRLADASRCLAGPPAQLKAAYTFLDSNNIHATLVLTLVGLLPDSGVFTISRKYRSTS